MLSRLPPSPIPTPTPENVFQFHWSVSSINLSTTCRFQSASLAAACRDTPWLHLLVHLKIGSIPVFQSESGIRTFSAYFIWRPRELVAFVLFIILLLLIAFVLLRKFQKLLFPSFSLLFWLEGGMFKSLISNGCSSCLNSKQLWLARSADLGWP